MFSLHELFKDIDDIDLAIVHPGVTLTNMTNHYPKAINWLVKMFIKLFFPPPKKACLSVVLGTSKCCNYLEWIGPKIFGVWGTPKISKLKTCNNEECKEIYEIAENIYTDICNKSSKKSK